MTNAEKILAMSVEELDSEVCRITDSDGNVITQCTVCNIEISPYTFIEAEMLRGEKYTVQILECKKCGAVSFGWIRKSNED